MAKKPFEMTFPEFADAVKACGSIRRLPEINHGLPVFQYTVYLNGEAATELPDNARVSHFQDVMVMALTRQLGLNHKDPRDNLKVSELAALRNSWLECVSKEHHRNMGWGSLEQLASDVLADYDTLTKGMVHPYIQQELNKQLALTKTLQPVLNDASTVLKKPVEDLVPLEVSKGMVVAQNNHFTVQQTTDGETVTHENRRLNDKPTLGKDVTISYYRGSGQVVDSLENVKVLSPFIEGKSGDLAVTLTDGKGRDQVVLFNSASGFDKFVKAHGLDTDLVRQAIDVLALKPKPAISAPVRDLMSDVYVDEESGCLAVDYKEDGVEYSVLFSNYEALEARAPDFGFDADFLITARYIRHGQKPISTKDVNKSLDDLMDKMQLAGVTSLMKNVQQNYFYAGKVVCESALHIVQDTGRGGWQLHDKRDLDKVANTGDSLTIRYMNGRGHVEAMVKSQEHGR